MRAGQKIFYRDWVIVPFSIPRPDGTWATSCELEKMDADGLNVFQGALDIFVSDLEKESINAACEDAKNQVDAIIADPLG